ncbi:MAG TPA: chloride channel protein, partial [Rhodothermales bacterium]
MGPALDSVRAPREHVVVSIRVAMISALAILLGFAAGFIAEALLDLIRLITNLSYFGRASATDVRPSSDVLGLWSILIPVAGALLIGVMARFGSAAIRGHGIPEVMEGVLRRQSRISPRVMFLKPLSAAIAIGTGGPFGAEGPIIATGGAVGSVLGQIIRITADERKTLLAAGAAAGMAATFGTPVSAVLLAVELLLFEYRPRSIIPVALAASAATVVRYVLIGAAPMFSMTEVAALTGPALITYVVLGAIIGALSVGVSRLVFRIEDGFDRLPVHWMWWPAMGAVVVGIVGYVDPRTLGVGYYNIEQILTGELAGTTLLTLVCLKLVSWSIYLGSGTSGGTLAPL